MGSPPYAETRAPRPKCRRPARWTTGCQMLTAARCAPPLAPTDASREMGDSCAASGAARVAVQRAVREKWRITFFRLKRPPRPVATADLTGADLFLWESPVRRVKRRERPGLHTAGRSR